MKSITIMINTDEENIDYEKLNKIKNTIISSFKENGIDLDDGFHIHIKCSNKSKVTAGSIRKSVIKYLKDNNIEYSNIITVKATKDSSGRAIRNSKNDIVEYVAKYVKNGTVYEFNVDGKTGDIFGVLISDSDGIRYKRLQ